MAKTLNCSDVVKECAFKVTVPDGQEEILFEAVLRHAKLSHPDIIPQKAEDMKQFLHEIEKLVFIDKRSSPQTNT